jgi:hypothetical protein
MSSIRETALLALFDRLKNVAGVLAIRNEVYPERIPSGGLIELEDGDPGEPEFTLSPLTYHYQHQTQLTCIVQKVKSEDRDAAMDDLLQRIGNAITANETDFMLGGAVEYLEMGAPDAISPAAIEGAEGIKATIAPVILFYSTRRPL